MAIRNIDHLVPGSTDILSEPQFRRFEADIRKICYNYPNSTTIRPVAMTLKSYTNKIRSSMGAFAKSNWISDISKETALEVRHRFKFTYDNNLGLVFIGAGAFSDHMTSARTEFTIEKTLVDSNDRNILNAICLLKHHDILKGTLVLSNMTLPLALDLMQEFPNVAIEMKDDGTALIV